MEITSSSGCGERISTRLGNTPAEAARTGTTVTFDTRALVPDDATRRAWAVAQWSVAVASPLAVDEVAVADQVWTRTTGAWQPTTTTPVATGRVVLTLAP